MAGTGGAPGTGGMIATGGGGIQGSGGTLGLGGSADLAQDGTVLAADFGSNFLIQTSGGSQFFSGFACLGVYVGDRVTFTTAPSLCLTNEISVRGSSCSLTCKGNGYPGAVVSSSANSNAFVVTTLFGDKLFPAQTACFDVLAGDQVVFTGFTGACASNSFADLRTGKFCNVWCQ